MSWAANAAKNIFPLSNEKANLGKALPEWEYRGVTYDLETPQEICQLCDHEDLRYQFEINNKENGNSLLIGSECITKFSSITVLDEKGNALSITEAKQKVAKDRRKLITDAQTKSLLNSLVELAKKEEQFDISSFEADYKRRKAFTPKQLATLFWRFEKHQVPFNKSYFKIHIRRQKDKDALLALQDFQLEKMWPCLSPSQKKYVRKNRIKVSGTFS